MFKVLLRRADSYYMNKMLAEKTVAKAQGLAVAALNPELPRAEQIERIKSVLEMLRGIAED